MINDGISLNSLDKRCKDNYHRLCDGQWKGLGVTVTCKGNSILFMKKILYWMDLMNLPIRIILACKEANKI